MLWCLTPQNLTGVQKVVAEKPRSVHEEKGCLGPPRNMAMGATADWVGTLMLKMAHPAENPSGYSHYHFQGSWAENGGMIS